MKQLHDAIKEYGIRRLADDCGISVNVVYNILHGDCRLSSIVKVCNKLKLKIIIVDAR